MPLIFNHLGVWLTTGADAPITKGVLMAHSNFGSHKEVRHALTPGARWLVCWSRIILQRPAGRGTPLLYRLVVADLPEHL